MKRLSYSGIGSRQTPQEVCEYFAEIASILEDHGFILRSGAADGADSAFERGVKNIKNKEIFLPWKEFNNHYSVLLPDDKCFSIVEKIHPAWNKLSNGAKKLQARNVKQVLGDNLDDPVEFVLCWTINGEIKGGTATAINIAKKLDIPVFNFGKYPSVDLMKIVFESFIENYLERRMNYNALPGTLILSVPEKDTVEQLESGLLVTNTKDVASTEIATVLSAGEDCGDIKVGMKLLYQTNTGYKLDKGVYFLKYEDVIAIITE